MCKQPTLFDFMDNIETFEVEKNTSIKVLDEKELKEILSQMKHYIENKVLIPSDFYFNIVTELPYKIIENMLDEGEYELKFASMSDSYRILKAYQNNPNIKPIEFLGLNVAVRVIQTLEDFIKNNPNASSLDMLDRFKIFEYPHYYARAKSDSKDELEDVAKLLIRFANLRELLNLSETKFSFMRDRKKTKLSDQIDETPRCFDGNCLDVNMMRMLKAVSN